ncbi:hypothetical protein DFJ74DRAFT_703539 [Hyaloraphidium curvatum]|nr:hypothetical protein DFJ74DRAFT_703539 [Hyaloraphidium curvatum]
MHVRTRRWLLLLGLLFGAAWLLGTGASTRPAPADASEQADASGAASGPQHRTAAPPRTFPASECPSGPQPPRIPKAVRLQLVDNIDGIRGWMAPGSAFLVQLLSQHQARLGICGAAAEIGVHHGRFASAVAHTLKGAERMLAVDVFSDQEKNLDGSGLGDRSIFERNMARFGVHPGRQSHVVQASSAELSAKDVLDAVGPVRLFSVDGGHTAEATEHDMGIATGACVDGCVVVVDDAISAPWPGVVEGIYRYLLLPSSEPRGLMPFLLYMNKMYFTTPNYHRRYLALLDAHPHFSVATSTRAHRTVVNGVTIRMASEGAKPNATDWQAWRAFVEASPE